MDTLTLFKGSSIAQVIPVIAIPFLARLFGSEAIGQFAIIYAIATIFGAIASMRLEFALVPAHEGERVKLLALIFIIIILMVILLVAGMKVVVVLTHMSHYSFKTIHTIYLALIAVMSAFVNVTNLFNTSIKRFSTIANAKIVLAATTFILQLSLGYLFNATVEILLISRIISLVLAFAILIRGHDWHKMLGTFRIIELVKMFPNYKQYYKYFWPASMIDIIARQTPLLLIGGFYGDSIAGYYSMAERVLSVPTTAISGAVSQSFYQKFISELKKRGNPKRVIYFTWKLLALGGIIPFVILFFYSADLITAFLGSEWIYTSEIIRMLVPLSYITFVSSSTSTGLIALNGQKYALIFTAYSLVNKALSIYYGSMIDDLLLGLLIMVIFQVIQIIAYNGTILTLLKKKSP